MRIAVSGTHCMGKSTFTEDFSAEYPSFAIIDEISSDDLGIGMADIFIDANIDSMLEQLELSLDRFEDNSCEENIIYDRCPLDYFAYTYLLMKQEANVSDNNQLFDYIEDIKNALSSLDYLIFFPITNNDTINTDACDDLIFRKKSDNMFKHIIENDPYDFFSGIDSPRLIQLSGSRDQRLYQWKKLASILM